MSFLRRLRLPAPGAPAEPALAPPAGNPAVLRLLAGPRPPPAEAPRDRIGLLGRKPVVSPRAVPAPEPTWGQRGDNEPGTFAGLFSAAPRTIDEQIQEARGGSALAVGNSAEFRRILELPRRPCPPDAPDQTERYRRPGGTMRLRPIQSAALVEAAANDGAFVPLGLGRGKTLIALLLPAAMRAERAVLLLPSSTRKSLAKLVAEYSVHFELPLERTTVVSYEELSSARTQGVLDEIRPDLIIADEAHKVTRSSARTRRFRRYLAEHPECRFVPMTGTPMSRSVLEVGPLCEQALKSRSPLPRGYNELRDWAGAMDPAGGVGPGVLRFFCEPGEDVRAGFSRRMLETPGVVSSPDDDLGIRLLLRRLDLELPERVQRVYDEVSEHWSLEGDVHESPLVHGRALRQLACGFYYRWAWPGGVPDYEWVEARSAWHHAARERLQLGLRGQDSLLLVARAADQRKWDCPEWWDWKPHKAKKPPPTETVWLSDFLVDDAIKRAQDGTIIWYTHRAVGTRLEQLGVPHYGAGADATDATAPVIACSVIAQGTGKNLQHRYHRNIYTSLPTDAKELQQSIGRTHRELQKKKEVWCEWYGHTDEARDAYGIVRQRAEHQQLVFREPQKILSAVEVE